MAFFMMAAAKTAHIVEHAHYITVWVKARDDYEQIARVCLGKDKVFAAGLFKQLRGNKEVRNSELLQFDLVEHISEVPVTIDIIACTLEQYAHNSRVLATALLTFHNNPGAG